MVNIRGHHSGRTKGMIDLLRDRLSKADRIIVQIERALKHFQVEERANRPGGCYCEDGEGGYHSHTEYCEDANTLMSSASWYLKKLPDMPDVLIDNRLREQEIESLKSQLNAWRNNQHERAFSLHSNWCRCGNPWPCSAKSDKS